MKQRSGVGHPKRFNFETVCWTPVLGRVGSMKCMKKWQTPRCRKWAGFLGSSNPRSCTASFKRVWVGEQTPHDFCLRGLAGLGVRVGRGGAVTDHILWRSRVLHSRRCTATTTTGMRLPSQGGLCGSQHTSTLLSTSEVPVSRSSFGCG